MMKHFQLFFLFGVIIASSVQQENLSSEVLQCFPNNLPKVSDPQSISTYLARSRLEFTVELTKNVLKRSKSGSNVFFSPHSIYQALLLVLFISNGKTESEIKTALRLPYTLDKLDILQWFKMDKEFERMRAMNASVGYELTNVNKFFYEQTLPVRDCMHMLFQDELQSLDFNRDPSAAKKIIDEWVSLQTRNEITDLLSGIDIDYETKLILVNAMYFKGLWQSKFLPDLTRKEVFYITPSKNSLVTMMRQRGNFKYLISEKLSSHVIDLPYKDNDISMYILLPSLYHPNGIKYLLEKLTTDLIEEIVEPGVMVERPVELGIPKFTVEQSLSELVPILESMGVNDLFVNSSDLSTLTGRRDFSFNEVVHKAKVSIDEEGTVAAASTAIFSFRSSRPLEPVKFICNHPFIYFIFDHVSQAILFIGMYNSPNQS